jgi:biopolymer transport protein ExbD
MRRFSQRSHLVTLSEINITPLLDLAFVLLIIFVITTPLLEQSLELKLPKGGRPERPASEKNFHTLEINPRGGYAFNGKPATLAQVEAVLIREAKVNPNVVLRIRADRTTPWDQVFQAQDLCAKHGIKVSLRSEPRGNK